VRGFLRSWLPSIDAHLAHLPVFQQENEEIIPCTPSFRRAWSPRPGFAGRGAGCRHILCLLLGLFRSIFKSVCAPCEIPRPTYQTRESVCSNRPARNSNDPELSKNRDKSHVSMSTFGGNEYLPTSPCHQLDPETKGIDASETANGVPPQRPRSRALTLKILRAHLG
jgi:hypothetical protein